MLPTELEISNASNISFCFSFYFCLWLFLWVRYCFCWLLLLLFLGFNFLTRNFGKGKVYGYRRGFFFFFFLSEFQQPVFYHQIITSHITRARIFFLGLSNVIIFFFLIFLDKFVFKTWISKRVFYFVGILSGVENIFLSRCSQVFFFFFSIKPKV